MAAGGSVPQFASLYVGDLHPDVTEAMLYEIFNSVGPVGSIRVCRDSVSRRSLGYGYVNFHSVSDAERALDTLNYSSIKGRACRIMWSQRDPSLRKSGVGNIFVKNLDRNIDNKALYDTFSLFGNILSCKVASAQDGKSRGYGFVHYETEEAAKQAIDRVNGMLIGDKMVEVQAFLKRNDRDTATSFTNIYCKNLPDDIDEDKLKAMFGEHGTITSSCILEDKAGRKFCFVNYEAAEAAQKAVAELHGKDLRTDAQKEETKEDAEAESYFAYVGRAQTKAERAREFCEKAKTGPATEGRASGVNLYIKNLDEGENNNTLKELFAPFGSVTSCIAMMDEKDKCRGFGFVCFNSPDEATKAVGNGGPSSGVNLYIKNLDEGENNNTLKELFAPFGSITSCIAMMDEKDNCKGFGFVCFNSPDEATKAVTEMHLKVVKGKPLYVGLAEKKDVRQERLRQRYSPSGGCGGGGGMGGGMGKGGKDGMGMDGMGGMGGMGKGMGKGPMGGMDMVQQGMMGGMGQQGMMGPMSGCGGMMGGQQMMGMMGKGGMMMNPMQMKGGMMGGPGGKGGPMMGNPQQMMAMQKGMMAPQMMGMMGGMKGGPMGGMNPMAGMMAGMMRPMMPQMMGAKGGMPTMPQQQQQQQMMQQQQQQQQRPSAGSTGCPGGPLTAAALASAPPGVQKQLLGEKLFPAISKYQPELAGKITGMMLEMDNSELLILLESEQQLRGKVDEAMRVLEVQAAPE
eukprot:CAMPEP_0204093676 /NCGR_PEP_ID=MMETSP0360-20130528/190540_1 /ASSEMBLY_ACC=CAM_ASM_000342 /TAXON_ID=268821 /ORGANISM="Scrippsiella Hangoei, Strain SHTV-5" /LENGTH=737 /DNA_ID=CAMNT_0051042975 /DNA_START=112 /DNA_END=2324 /DNA_ORIENTATION=-